MYPGVHLAATLMPRPPKEVELTEQQQWFLTLLEQKFQQQEDTQFVPHFWGTFLLEEVPFLVNSRFS